MSVTAIDPVPLASGDPLGVGADFALPSLEEVGADRPPAAGEGGFGALLADALEKLAGLQEEAAIQSQALATGRADDVTSVVMAVERASLALQLAVQVRNRAVEAYQDIFRMPL